MSKKPSKQNFFANVDPQLNLAFGKQWRNRKQQKNQATTAALKLWINLPKETQGILITWDDLTIQKIASILDLNLKKALQQALIVQEQSRKKRKEDDSKSA